MTWWIFEAKEPSEYAGAHSADNLAEAQQLLAEQYEVETFNDLPEPSYRAYERTTQANIQLLKDYYVAQGDVAHASQCQQALNGVSKYKNSCTFLLKNLQVDSDEYPDLATAQSNIAVVTLYTNGN